MSSSSGPSAGLEIPKDLELPEELRGAPPRPLPESVKFSRKAASRRNVLIGSMIAGGLCLVLEPMPFVKTMALYFLPLEYLFWIGIVLCVLGAFGYVLAREYKKGCRYVREGEASFGRVLQLAKTPTAMVHGQPASYVLAAQVEMRHPETGEFCLRDIHSSPIQSWQKDRIKARFRVGDIVPVIWLPNQFEKTLTIYDFLEITPEASLLRQNSKPTPWYQVALGVLLVVGIFFALFWNVYAWGRFEPLDFDYLKQGFWPLFAGGVLGLIGIVAVLVFEARKTRQLDQRNAEAEAAGEAVEPPVKKSTTSKVALYGIAPLGGILLGAATVFSWCLTANALFDRSPRQPEPVTITEMIETTHDLIFREYTLKFRRQNDQKDLSLMTTPEHLSEFQLPLGTAQIRGGRFGWKWVETVDPIRIGRN